MLIKIDVSINCSTSNFNNFYCVLNCSNNGIRPVSIPIYLFNSYICWIDRSLRNSCLLHLEYFSPWSTGTTMREMFKSGCFLSLRLLLLMIKMFSSSNMVDGQISLSLPLSFHSPRLLFSPAISDLLAKCYFNHFLRITQL